MKRISGNQPLSAGDRGAVAAIGNFDGVHRGHLAIIDRARGLAKIADAPLGVITFEPHPRALFQPDALPFRLSCADTRAAALAEIGVDVLYELNFDHDFSQFSAEEFATQVLRDHLGLKHLVVGYDFVFGHRRRGTPEMLVEMADELEMQVTRMDAVTEEDGAAYSSTRIRQCLSEGDPKGASALLGRPWEAVAEVVLGDQRGRTLGFPTANLRLGDLVHPAHGVYAVQAALMDEDGPWIKGVANFGRRPTVNDLGPLLEVHLFDVSPDLYGKRLKVRLIDFIRPEMKFDGLDALKAQIAQDGETARQLLAVSAPSL
jgi:riboflavin kinase/FMN adenylyltransferase